MKKFLLTFLLLIFIIPSTVFAFEQPDSNRWLWAGSDDKTGVWIDMQTIKYNIDYNRFSPCKGHRLINSWELWYDATDNTSNIVNKEYDLDCRTVIYLESHLYDNNGNIIDSVTGHSQKMQVIPGSWGESLMNCMNLLWKMHKN